MQRFAILALASLLAAAGAAAQPSVHVAFAPAALAVAPGEEFDLRIVVTQPGAGFNSYHAIVGYDAGSLTFLQRPATEQEGSYLKNACGNTFHHFVASASELDISHAIVCPGITLVGPGELYKLRFRASSGPGAGLVFFAQVDFANAGSPVAVQSGDAVVVDIAGPTDAGAFGTRPRWSVVPNPVRAGGALHIETWNRTPDVLVVTDARGRSVDRQEWTSAGLGPHRFVWNATDRRGRGLPSGVYFVSIGTNAQRLTKRIVVIE